ADSKRGAVRRAADGTRAELELALDLGWRLAEPDELRMRVRKARARVRALVHERMQVSVTCRGARLPRLRDDGDLLVRQLGEEVTVSRGVDDHLLACEGGVEVGHDADLPGGLPGGEA